jgi:hypothetical protein
MLQRYTRYSNPIETQLTRSSEGELLLLSVLFSCEAQQCTKQLAHISLRRTECELFGTLLCFTGKTKLLHITNTQQDASLKEKKQYSCII